ncbi:MAG: nicotinamidase [Candidatus Schekmanbacteria bacterium]|nr:nicotinamidase [Candidatus Schekmanbacteria bacterium]
MSHSTSHSTPSFYDPAEVGSIYLERAALVANEALAYRQKHGVRPSGQDKFRVAAFGIDCQVGFCAPGASLFVPGAVADTCRTIEWLYANIDRITGLCFSMDTHRVFQIFHPAWWVDKDGHHPAPLTAIPLDDVRSGRWLPIAHPKECLEYCQRLEATGKYVLTIWPYHTLLGGVSHALVPALMEAAIFHSIVRRHQTHFETKGTHAMTENYSVLSPEVKELGGQVVGAFNTSFFKMLMEYDRVYVFGQAKSHCVLSTLRDLKEQIHATDPSMAQKVWILEDAMSPVPAPPLDPLPAELNFPVIAERAMSEFRQAGFHVVRTMDAIVY